MNCPQCGYAMGPFDVECERCRRMAALKPAEPRAREAAPVAPAQVPVAPFRPPVTPAKPQASAGHPLSAGGILLGCLGAVILGVVMLVALCDTPVPTSVSSVPAPGFVATTPSGPSLADFQAIEAGMTRAQVESILGPGELLSQVSLPGVGTSEMYQWTGRGDLGANMNVSFQDGCVVSKAQFGLR